jgi:nicotinic acid mononucleotide adenylyltransferase
VYVVPAATPDVSSTEIRRRLRAGEPIAGMVPDPVEQHIRQHRLYLEDVPSGLIHSTADQLHGKD